MKILFVIDAYFTHNNGTSISAQRFADELRKRTPGHYITGVLILKADMQEMNRKRTFTVYQN